jgi:hypothetical protein
MTKGIVFAEPVRYMVVNTWYGYKILDTLTEHFKTVKRFLDFDGWGHLRAHERARFMNLKEGYAYWY